MKEAGKVLGKSDFYIVHLEGGWMDIPSGEKLDQLFAIYGGIKQKSFYEMARLF